MKDQLQAIIQAKTEEDILDAFDNYLRDFSGINSPNNHLIYSNLDSLFSKPELHAIKSLENGKRLGFISIQVNDNLSEKSGKKSQYDLAKTLLKENERYFDYGIFLFYDTECNFRYSLIFNTIQENKRAFNTYKRYTYFVDNTQPNTTFLKRIAPLQYDNLEQIVEAFSVEKVNEEFYRSIATWFHKLVGAKTAKENYETLFTLPSADPETNHKLYQDFAVRLIGRIVFVWFLKFKKDIYGQGLIPDQLISSKAVQHYPDYYHHIVEKVFFEILNKKRRDNIVIDSIKEYADNIPYLNGGLFEPLIEDYYEVDIITGYSEYHNTLRIDDGLFTELFNILEQYNFTIDENSASDIEVSVDPEMLGRIFENLLGEINPETGETARKSTGSFYTPRSIVEYMVRQTLLQYLEDKTSLEKKQLEPLFYEGTQVELDQKEILSIIKSLDELKILDPACGSGAYPMGILQQILIILKNIDSDNSLWLEQILSTITDETLKKEIRANTAIDYIRKLGVIQRSIFGVDIQESAVEISRLRFFLSLIVDQSIDSDKKDRGIQALPNLDFKFVSANTLISLPKGGTWEDSGLETNYINKLKIYFGQFFSSHGEEKKDLALKITQAQKSLANTMRKGSFKAGIADKIADWEPFSHKGTDWFDPEWMFGVTEGFDIVIGNPPYIQLQKKELIPEYMSKAYKAEGYLTFKSTGDIYALFYEKGFDLLRKDGILCYITSNKWMRAGYGEVLRGYFAEYTIPLQLIDFGGFKVFKSATVDTNIYLAKKGNTDFYYLKAVHFKNDFKQGDTLSDYINQNSLILNNLSKDTWFIGSKAEIALKEKIEKLGKPLKDWDVKINYGIKTGFNEAFIIDSETRTRLIKEDPKSEEIIKPILRGRDIKRYGYDFANLYVIIVKFGFAKELENYPAILNHLTQFEEKLRSRGQCNTSRTGKKITGRKGDTGQHHWLELDNNPNDLYLQQFAKEKVVWTPVNSEYSFSVVDSDIYMNNSLFMITGGSPRYLCAYFNSKLFRKYITYLLDSETSYTYGSKSVIEKSPIPILDNSARQTISKQIEYLVNQILEAKKQNKDTDTTNLEAEIDELVMDLYELTEEEREIVRR